MKKTVYKAAFALLCAMVIALCSCFGASADISINANGSGKIALEYRVSQMLEEIGRLDGNAHWPAVPVGKEDFERTVRRIPGLSLSSFSAKEVSRKSGGKDLVTKAVLQFKNTDALLAFLDSTGTAAVMTQCDGKKALRIALLDSASDDAVDADLLSLMRDVSAGYELRFNFSLPKDAGLSMTSPVPSAQLASKGKKVSVAIPMGDLIGLQDGLAIEVTW